MKTLFTQCPDCGTTFKLDETQLQAANGVVRCGACLHVFNAIEHYLPQHELGEVIDANAETEADGGEWSQLIADIPEDEAWVVDLLSEMNESPDQAPAESDRNVASPSDTTHADDADDASFSLHAKNTHATDTMVDAFSLHVDGDIDKIKAEFEATPENKKLATNTTHPSYQQDQQDQQGSVLTEDLATAGEEIKAPQPDKPTIDISSPLVSQPVDASNIEIEPDPIELPNRKGNSAAMLVLTVLLSIVIVASIAWFKREVLNQYEFAKVPLALLCNYAPCNLSTDQPPLFTEGLTVRPHPNYPGALTMNVWLVNPATAEQVLPSLKLTIANSRGQTLAASAFSPDEYLPKELRDYSVQPPNSTVEIELQLVEPAGGATRYQIEILPTLN